MKIDKAVSSANVDASEIRKFRKMAAQWWDEDGVMKSLHDINPLRTEYIASRIPLRGAMILDAGCGGGLLSEAMTKAGADVTGIDMGDVPLMAARRHAEISGLQIRYRRMTVEEMAARHPGAFDGAVCMELLEHVPDPASVVRSCGELVKPGGDVIFATLNRNLKSLVFAIIGAEYVLRLLPAGTHRYEKFVRPEEIETWGRTAGLQVQDVTGLQYNPFTRRYFLNRNVSVNYMIHLRRRTESSLKNETVEKAAASFAMRCRSLST